MGRRSRVPAVLTRTVALAGVLALPLSCQASKRSPPSTGLPTAGAGTTAGTAEGAAGGTAAGATPPAQAVIPAGRALVIFGADTVVAEIAKTDAERERGLMYRRDVPAGTGMFFVFPDSRERSFWMENTYVPLDVAFMDASLVIFGIEQMEAETTEYHDSKGPAMYALEVPKGWFAAHKIRVGTRAKLVVSGG